MIVMHSAVVTFRVEDGEQIPIEVRFIFDGNTEILKHDGTMYDAIMAVVRRLATPDLGDGCHITLQPIQGVKHQDYEANCPAANR